MALLALAAAVLAALPVSGGLPAGAAAAAPTLDGMLGLGASDAWVVVAPAFAPGPGIAPLGPLPAGTAIGAVVGLAPSDPAGLSGAIGQLYTPGSSEYRHYLTPQEIAAEYGPSSSGYDAAVAYFHAAGLTVRTSPDHTILTVQGTSALVARAFGTSFEVYGRGTGWFYDHPQPARLPGGLPWAGLVGLENETSIAPAAAPIETVPAAPGPSGSGCSPSSWGLTPCQAHNVYNLTRYVKAGTNGTGYRIGIVDTYDALESQDDLQSDLARFASIYGLPYGNVSWVYPVPSTTDLNQSVNIWGTEEALDLEWSRAMAPGASIDMTFAPDSTYGLYSAVDYLVANHAVDEISLSWGENDVGVFDAADSPCYVQCNATTDGSYQLLHPVLEAAAAEGIGVFSASGDCGASAGTSGVSTNYPASDPYVTGVGGTDLTLNTTGNWGGETGWSGNSSGATVPGCDNQGGSSGGWSPFPRPYWQSGPGLSKGPALRGVPDVSALAGAPGVPIVLGGNNGSSGGTSLSTPMWAGLSAVADQADAVALGDLNPSLYEVARSPSYDSAFHDVTAGWNGYPAGAGWDPVTGLGSPSATALFPLLSATRLSEPRITVNLTASPRFGAAPLTVTFRANASGGARPYDFFDVAFGDGNSSRSANGVAVHRYTVGGVYAATAVVFDNGSNSSVSVPVAVVVGGGRALAVTLNATPTDPKDGAAVSFAASVAGGSGYALYYAFGDGSYQASDSLAVAHVYAGPGAYCAAVVVSDDHRPPDGAASPAVGVGVGGVPAPNCTAAGDLIATLHASPGAADLPGDLAFSANATGGAPPYSVELSSPTDPYVGACQCGIFSEAGNHSVFAQVSDSGDLQTLAARNVTIYPALSARFSANRSSGAVPLSVGFAVSDVSGGHGSPSAIAAGTRWAFGDGTSATGASVGHGYIRAGWYVAVATSQDGTGGTASEAFLIDAYGAGPPPATLVSANVTPAVDVPAGTPVTMRAQVAGTAGPYLTEWSLGANDSAFGPDVTQTYAYSPCLASGSCPLSLGLGVQDAAGLWTNVSIALGPAQHGSASALLLADKVGPSGGTTPFLWHASAAVSGMPNATVNWTFGDGANATGLSGNHTYLAPGNYTVTETATDPYGDRLVRTHAVVVAGLVRLPPTLAAGVNVTSGLAPLAVAFFAQASGGAGSPYNYTWDFGDGYRATANDTAHVYDAPGRYTAIVQVLDALRSPASSSFVIDVYNTTSVAFEAPGWNGTAVIGQPLRVSVLVSPACGALSVPGCAASAVPFRAAILPAGAAAPGAGSTAGVAAQAGPGGWANVTLVAPATAGAYVLYLWSAARGYWGTNGFDLSVNATRGSKTGTGPSGPSMTTVAAVGFAVAALAVLAAVIVLRRRRATRPAAPAAARASPSRPRGGAGGRRGG
jgi:kumamolisin